MISEPVKGMTTGLLREERRVRCEEEDMSDVSPAGPAQRFIWSTQPMTSVTQRGP
jgi:hypothetical protein